MFDDSLVKDSLEGAFNSGGWFQAWSERSDLNDVELESFAYFSERFGTEALARDGQRFAGLSPNLSKAQSSE
jgi:hypothetical protein